MNDLAKPTHPKNDLAKLFLNPEDLQNVYYKLRLIQVILRFLFFKELFTNAEDLGLERKDLSFKNILIDERK